MKKPIKIQPSGACELCISHRRGKGGFGYPETKREGHTISVVRDLWERRYGAITDGLLLHNKCGDLRCVNLDHYEMLTTSELVEATCPRGEKKVNSKLTESDARTIKHSLQGYKSLAVEYDVSWSTIRNIKKGLRWKHVS